MRVLQKSFAIISVFTWVTAFSLRSSALPTLRFPLGVVLENFDPTEAEDFITVRVLLNLGRGLMMSDNHLKPVTALAASYKISKSGKVYTFKLKHVLWSDGKPLTAQDFIYGFQRTLSPTTKAKLSQNLQELIVGAKDFKTKKTTDFASVGVKATDENTLQFELNHPSGYFLSLLALPFCFPQREGGVIKAGSPTIGPYVIGDLKSNSKILLTPNLKFEKPPQNQVELKVITESASMLSLYEKKELDVLEKVPSSDFDRFKNSPELVSAPFLATYYLGFNVTKKPFDDVNIRKTIFGAINRHDLSKILKDPQIIASSLVPTPLTSSDHPFKIAAPTPAPKISALELAMDAQEKNNIIAALIQQQLKTKLGIDLQIKSMEWKSYLSYLTHGHPGFFRFAWLSTFPDPLSHLNVFTSDNPNNYTGYANPKYDEMISQISNLENGSKRTKLIIKAQQLLLEKDAVIMPLYHYKNYYLISSRWQGIEATPMGILYFDQAVPKHVPGSTL